MITTPNAFPILTSEAEFVAYVGNKFKPEAKPLNYPCLVIEDRTEERNNDFYDVIRTMRFLYLADAAALLAAGGFNTVKIMD